MQPASDQETKGVYVVSEFGIPSMYNVDGDENKEIVIVCGAYSSAREWLAKEVFNGTLPKPKESFMSGSRDVYVSPARGFDLERIYSIERANFIP